MAVERDLTALPSYAHLNRAQRRAFILRDNLKYLDSRHLDTYILGIELPERNGRIQTPKAKLELPFRNCLFLIKAMPPPTPNFWQINSISRAQLKSLVSGETCFPFTRL